MSAPFTPADPDFVARTRRSFEAQTLMATLGIRMTAIVPGAVEVAMASAPHIRQQHGFVHGGAVASLADTACGFAALTLMPAGTGVLTVELKMNLMAPAVGDEIVAHGRVVKAGRTLIVTQADVVARADGRERAIALMTATMMVVEGRDGIVD